MTSEMKLSASSSKGMWVSFQHIILCISLYTTAIALGGILNYFIDTSLKDPVTLNNSYTYTGSPQANALKNNIAMLIVSFPIFGFMFYSIQKQLLTNKTINNLIFRKILIYITLLITFLLMFIHLIATLFQLLDGKITLNSIAHLAVTIVIAGSIFLYLLLEVKNDSTT